eukprot:GHVT01056897.1.p3 GENE.GHVT01056897.1~~GHVT01056897.1.p3  ORF type:complete len:120 (+),score=15.36 GHVT01056897.1:103-462(+)
MFSLFLHLCLAALCSAAPIADDFTTLNSNATQYGTGGGIIGFIVLVLDILVWIEVLKSSRPVSHKLLWSVLVFVFPSAVLLSTGFFPTVRSGTTATGMRLLLMRRGRESCWDKYERIWR